MTEDFCLFFSPCLLLPSALTLSLVLAGVGVFPFLSLAFWLCACDCFWLFEAFDFSCLASSPDESEDEEEEDEEETAFFFAAALLGAGRETVFLAVLAALADAKGRASSSFSSSEEEDEDED